MATTRGCCTERFNCSFKNSHVQCTIMNRSLLKVKNTPTFAFQGGGGEGGGEGQDTGCLLALFLGAYKIM